MKRNWRQWLKVKKEAAERDGGMCAICGAPAVDVHHVRYRSHGGKDELGNVVCLCRACHEMAHGVKAKEVREYLQAYLREGNHHV